MWCASTAPTATEAETRIEGAPTGFAPLFQGSKGIPGLFPRFVATVELPAHPRTSALATSPGVRSPPKKRTRPGSGSATSTPRPPREGNTVGVGVGVGGVRRIDRRGERTTGAGIPPATGRSPQVPSLRRGSGTRLEAVNPTRPPGAEIYATAKRNPKGEEEEEEEEEEEGDEDRRTSQHISAGQTKGGDHSTKTTGTVEPIELDDFFHQALAQMAISGTLGDHQYPLEIVFAPEANGGAIERHDPLLLEAAAEAGEEDLLTFRPLDPDLACLSDGAGRGLPYLQLQRAYRERVETPQPNRPPGPRQGIIVEAPTFLDATIADGETIDAPDQSGASVAIGPSISAGAQGAVMRATLAPGLGGLFGPQDEPPCDRVPEAVHAVVKVSPICSVPRLFDVTATAVLAGMALRGETVSAQVSKEMEARGYPDDMRGLREFGLEAGEEALASIYDPENEVYVDAVGCYLGSLMAEHDVSPFFARCYGTARVVDPSWWERSGSQEAKDVRGLELYPLVAERLARANFPLQLTFIQPLGASLWTLIGQQFFYLQRRDAATGGAHVPRKVDADRTMSLFAQAVFGLAAAQGLFELRHNDMHLDNVLYEEVPEDTVLYYARRVAPADDSDDGYAGFGGVSIDDGALGGKGGSGRGRGAWPSSNSSDGASTGAGRWRGDAGEWEGRSPDNPYGWILGGAGSADGAEASYSPSPLSLEWSDSIPSEEEDGDDEGVGDGEEEEEGEGEGEEDEEGENEEEEGYRGNDGGGRWPRGPAESAGARRGGGGGGGGGELRSSVRGGGDSLPEGSEWSDSVWDWEWRTRSGSAVRVPSPHAPGSNGPRPEGGDARSSHNGDKDDEDNEGEDEGEDEIEGEDEGEADLMVYYAVPTYGKVYKLIDFGLSSFRIGDRVLGEGSMPRIFKEWDLTVWPDLVNLTARFLAKVGGPRAIFDGGDAREDPMASLLRDMLTSIMRCKEGTVYSWWRTCYVDGKWKDDCVNDTLWRKPYVRGAGCYGGDPADNLDWFDVYKIDPEAVPKDALVYIIP